MPELIIGGITLAGLNVAIIELLKRYAGLTSERAPLVHGILNVIAFALVTLSQVNPQWADVITHAVWAVAVFLQGVGLYEWQVKPRVR